MGDLIDRQAAIDALKNDMASLDHIIQGMSGYDVRLDAYVSQRNQVNCDIDTISNLPPAQPEPCEDAVSRKAVKDGFVEMCSLICPYTEKQRHTMCGSCLLGTAFDVLEATQPVTPKQRTGHWHITDAYPHNVYCSECHKRFAQTHWAVWEDGSLPRNFCPNCGAKMISEGKTCDCYSDGRCIGTKEIDPCSCGGDKSKCDFYDYVREGANNDT